MINFNKMISSTCRLRDTHAATAEEGQVLKNCGLKFIRMKYKSSVFTLPAMLTN